MVACTVDSNVAVGAGGGVVADLSADLVLRGCEIHGNVAESGGGVCIAAASASVTGCSIVGNEATFGGGVNMMSATDVSVSDTDLEDNDAGHSGGGIHSSDSSWTAEGCLIAGNVSSGDGGALWLGNSEVLIGRTSIAANAAGVAGDGVFVSGTSLEITSGEFSGNGVAIHVDGVPDEPVVAQHNWWGDGSGPYNARANPGGLGDEVSDYVVFEPWNPSSGGTDGSSGVVLNACFPNPLGDVTTVAFRTPHESRAWVRIYDVRGRLVAVLLGGRAEGGTNAVTWDGRDASGARVAAGVYFVRLDAEAVTLTRSVVVVR